MPCAVLSFVVMVMSSFKSMITINGSFILKHNIYRPLKAYRCCFSDDFDVDNYDDDDDDYYNDHDDDDMDDGGNEHDGDDNDYDSNEEKTI